jgi:hypothetical protein
VISETDPYGRTLGFLHRSRYFFFQVAPQLYSRDWVDRTARWDFKWRIQLFLAKNRIQGLQFVTACHFGRKYANSAVTHPWDIFPLFGDYISFRPTNLYVTPLVLVPYTSVLQPRVREDISRGKQKHLTSIKTKYRNRLNLQPALILALTKIRSRIEVLACQKQAQ